MTVEVTHARGMVGADFVRMRPDVFRPREVNFHSRTIPQTSGEIAVQRALEPETPGGPAEVTEVTRSHEKDHSFGLSSVVRGLKDAAHRVRLELTPETMH